ncbi:MAG: SDR family oxidoreductase [Alphaproteobacteria bacterium]|nr:SDR family oxidoreductase [Alphaproteobacteria bacterium]
MNKLFCFGYGYTCDYLGYALAQHDRDWVLAGTTRDSEKRMALRARGITAHIFDYEHPLADPYHALEGTTHLLISTPPDDAGDPSFNMHAEDVLQISTLRWLGYLSTTSVYGDRDGGIVDETSELRPTSKRGSRRMEAEQQWLSLCHSHGLPVHIFRLAGIYGPGRSALDSVRAGVARRISKPGHAFGRVHVEDIVQTLMASFTRPQAGQVYNVVDDIPAPSHEVIEYACQLLGKPVPPLVNFEDANLAPITRSFYMDNRHTLNNKIKTELGVSLKYPNFRAGLEGCLAAEDYALAQFGHGAQQYHSGTV